MRYLYIYIYVHVYMYMYMYLCTYMKRDRVCTIKKFENNT